MKEAIKKAGVLIEALPYIKEFKDKNFVIKYGGSAMKKKKFREFFIQDIALLSYVGINPVIVHGGGDDVNALAEKLGKRAVFVDGHRVTDRETLEIVEKVLVGKINKRIVKDLKKHGLDVMGISGKDVNLIIARKKLLKTRDIGFVGEVKKVNAGILKTFETSDVIPVIAPVGKDEKGTAYNINADSVAGELAKAIKAEKLIYLTDTDGVRIKGRTASTIKAGSIAGYSRRGYISGGMLPKLDSARKAVKAGVSKVHIINGAAEHSLLLEIFTKKGIGTEIIK